MLAASENNTWLLLLFLDSEICAYLRSTYADFNILPVLDGGALQHHNRQYCMEKMLAFVGVSTGKWDNNHPLNIQEALRFA